MQLEPDVIQFLVEAVSISVEMWMCQQLDAPDRRLLQVIDAIAANVAATTAVSLIAYCHCCTPCILVGVTPYESQQAERLEEIDVPKLAIPAEQVKQAIRLAA